MAGLECSLVMEDGIGWLTIDRPPLNVLDTALLDAFAASLADLSARPNIRLAVIRGRGKIFSAGVEVREHLGPELGPMLDAFARAATGLLSSAVPTLAVAQGKALGGACELVALADLALVADDAVLGVPEIGLGVVPPVAAACFPRLVGAQRAAAMILTGEPVSGAEAARIGLVWRSVPADRLEDETRRVVERFRGLSASALRLARRTLQAMRLPLEQAILEATAIQARSIPELADAQEGLRAFLEKRPPVWSHR